MDVLVLGASGQVGQALILEFDRRGWSWSGSFHEHPVDPRLFRLDLSDLDAVAEAVKGRKPDAVFLPSGWTWVDGCEDDPERARRVNALAPEAAAKACRALGSRLVFYSTDYVFGENGGPYDEASPTEPLGAYGRSKLEGEQRVLAACPAALVLRTTVVYGPEPQGKNFIYQLIRNLKAGKTMTLPSDQLSTVTFNRDLARASVELAQAGESGVWNACGPQLIDRFAFGSLAAKVFGLDAGLLRASSTADMKQKARRPLAAGLRTDKLVGRLGWSPRDPLAGLESMRTELEANGQWAQLMAGPA